MNLKEAIEDMKEKLKIIKQQIKKRHLIIKEDGKLTCRNDVAIIWLPNDNELRTYQMRLDELTDSKDYIDLSISNNLLISNRKLRRKLETLLEKGSFASVEYIDDIVKVDENGDVITESVVEDENGESVSVELEYEDYIRDYIAKQKYDNERFKLGVLGEYNEVVKIYNENYKSLRD